jgi:transcriptional regulator with XRE-family HTH domain
MNKTAQKAIRKNLGERVQKLRLKRGWTQEALAKHCGLHRNYIGHIERGEFGAGIINVCQLAEAFGMTVSQFLKGI